MASEHNVRKYLSHWFQLGKRVYLQNGNVSCLPQPVFQGDRYSSEFEECWEKILTSGSGDCYLEGTHQTVQELLSDQWEISPCARCDMPVPMVSLGMPTFNCPCSDLPSWPDTSLPKPRAAVDSTGRLNQIRDRLTAQLSNPTQERSDSPNQ